MQIPSVSPLSRVPIEPDYIFANGQVLHGRIEIGAKMTILEAVSRIGATEVADLSAVTLVREHPSALVAVVDMLQMVKTGDTTDDILLWPGDTILIPERGRRQE